MDHWPKTGIGHGTDIAVMMGLTGEDPVTMVVSHIPSRVQDIRNMKKIDSVGRHEIDFDPAEDIEFLYSNHCLFIPMRSPFWQPCLMAIRSRKPIIRWAAASSNGKETESSRNYVVLPFPINTSEDLLHWCRKTGMSIHEVVMENESAWRSEQETRKGILEIWNVMKECMYRGCHTEGYLPGGLQVKRRAYSLNKRLVGLKEYHDYTSWKSAIQEGGHHFQYILDCVSCFALSVNEENASFGRVVTAPTNGAAGVIPAVLQYYICFGGGDSEEKIIQFLLTASEIGSIFKKGATISAAMGGCQAEIG